MKSVNLILVLIVFLNACNFKNQRPKNNGKLPKESPYLGQKPPGLTPEVFAPGIVSTDGWEYGATFTPNLSELYVLKEQHQKMIFVVFQNKDGQWQESYISSRKGQPFISRDGKTMYLGNGYKERTENGWSEVKKLESPFDTLPTMRLTVSAKGTYFFDEFKEDFKGDIRYSRLINDKHEKPKLLNQNINSGKSFHPFIAPDESYLIFDSSRDDGFGDSDIYISFKRQDDSWGEAINLGNKINTEAWEAAASVTPDGKYLFFHRMADKINKDSKYPNVDIFWSDFIQLKKELNHKVR